MTRVKRVVGKRASVQDGVFIFVILFVVAVLALFSLNFLEKYNEKVQDSNAFPQGVKDLTQKSTNVAPGALNALFGFLLIGGLGAIIITSLFIDANPAFYVVAFIFVVIAGIVVLMTGNVYDEMARQPALSTQADELNVIGFIMQDFFRIFIIFIFVVLIALYAKGRFSAA